MKDWTTLKKDDILYLLVPVKTICGNDMNFIKYEYQESKVINIHQYENLVNVRFKYTGTNGKRFRVELAINKYKYNSACVANDKRTGYAANYKPKYGDLIVSYISRDEVNNMYKEIIQNEIIKYEQLVELQRKTINQLKTIQYNYI